MCGRLSNPISNMFIANDSVKSSCMDDWESGSFWNNAGESFCTNATLVTSVNSCVGSSSCSGSEKECKSLEYINNCLAEFLTRC